MEHQEELDAILEDTELMSVVEEVLALDGDGMDDDGWEDIEMLFREDTVILKQRESLVYALDDIGLDDYEIEADLWVDDTPGYDD